MIITKSQWTRFKLQSACFAQVDTFIRDQSIVIIHLSVENTWGASLESLSGNPQYTQISYLSSLCGLPFARAQSVHRRRRSRIWSTTNMSLSYSDSDSGHHHRTFGELWGLNEWKSTTNVPTQTDYQTEGGADPYRRYEPVSLQTLLIRHAHKSRRRLCPIPCEYNWLSSDSLSERQQAPLRDTCPKQAQSLSFNNPRGPCSVRFRKIITPQKANR